MSTRTRTGPYSFAEFLELIPEDRKADLIDGAEIIGAATAVEALVNGAQTLSW